ncbi:MAG: IPTL-CTERM sorting domain-containing protein [Comamonadaceae bacterium]|nr:IPTL-CTERM sorting domain-containing protein [Comamonadaceae bacterium]
MTLLREIKINNNLLTGNIPAVPVPNALVAGSSSLCPSGLNPVPNAAWDTATGVTPWYTNCSSSTEKYSVTYNGNGSTGGTVPVDSNGTYSSGASVTVSGVGTLTRAGYTFAGWNTTHNGSGTSYAPAAIFAIELINVTLYAQWTPIAAPTYTLTYNGNGNTGGNVPNDGNTYASGATETVLSNSGGLVRTGFNFTGWNLAANGSSTNFTPGAGIPIGQSNVTLYAQWTPIAALTYTVTYHSNGNTGGNVPNDGNTYANGATATVLSNSGGLVRTGFNFTGWNLAADGSSTNFTPGAGIPIGQSNVTLYAQWTTIINVPATYTSIPTLSNWGFLILACLMVLIGLKPLRRLSE